MLPNMIDPAGGLRRHRASLDRALRLADEVSERIASLIRVAIFFALLIAVLAAQSLGSDHPPLEAATAIYGIGTLIGLLAAYRRRFHPLLPFAFVAFDTVTLVVAILMLGRSIGLPPSLSFTLPVSGLVLIVLVHASMRYRPGLVLFGAGILVASITFGTALFGGATAYGPYDLIHEDLDHLRHFQVFPIAVLALAAIILVASTWRTRKFIEDAFRSATRAAALSRYFSSDIFDEVTSRSEANAISGERKSVAVLFADVQGFTAMAEAMDPTELSRFLSEFRERIAEPVAAHDGVIDKYIGDAVMVVFGAPRPSGDDARHALSCALAMVGCMDAWSAERVREGKPPIAIGIGGHYGDVFAGVLSDGQRLEYTVIGDTVNIASRLARLPRSLATPLVVSAALVEAAGGLPPEETLRWERLPHQQLPGHPRPLTVFRLRGHAGSRGQVGGWAVAAQI